MSLVLLLARQPPPAPLPQIYAAGDVITTPAGVGPTLQWSPSGIAVLVGSRYPACPALQTMTLQFRLVRTDGLPLTPSQLDSLTLTLADAESLASGTPVIVNGVDELDVLNFGRGSVDAFGNVTITLAGADTAILTADDPFEARSAIVEWTYANGAGAHRVDFQITDFGV